MTGFMSRFIDRPFRLYQRRAIRHGQVVGILACLLASGMASGGIYKWRDAKGVMHYSESLPENVPASEGEIEPPPSPASVEAARQRLDGSEWDYHQRTDAWEAEKQQLEARQQAEQLTQKARMRQCADSLVQLRILEKTVPVYRDENGAYHTQTSFHSAGYAGKRRYLEDEERATEITSLQQLVDEACAPGEALESRARERLVADYHLQQCLAARELLVELERERLDRHNEDVVAVMQDIDRHCHRPGR